jgi:hypothetical protein
MNFGHYVLIVVIVVVFLLLVSAGSRNRRAETAAQRDCPNCRSAHPSFAEFCRRCGKRLG